MIRSLIAIENPTSTYKHLLAGDQSFSTGYTV